MPDDLPIGSELLGYRIEGLLGRGGMGIVYLAEDLRLKRRVALKLLSPELASDERFRDRLLTESEIAASLDHPNIVPIYQTNEVDGLIFISMRYVEGKGVDDVLREGPLSADRALAIVSQVASALDAAHARGLVHRDVKPSNVLIDPGAGHEGADHVYLADFGLSRRLTETTGAEPEDERSLGTVDYVAPEQIRGEEVDGRADVYALGCLLYECLAGEPPFARRSDAATLFAHLSEEPPTLPGLEEVLPRALAKASPSRYGTCRELVEAARDGLGLGMHERRPRRLVVFSAVLLVIAAVAVGVLLARSGGSGASTATGRLARIDPTSNAVTKTLAVGQDPSGIAVGGGHVWVTSLPDSALWRVDAKTGQTRRLAVSVSTPIGVAVRTGLGFGDPLASAVRGTVAFVAGSGGVTMVSGGSGQQTGTIPIGDATVVAGGRAGIWAVAGTVDRLVNTSFGVGKAVTKVTLPHAAPADEAHQRVDEAGIAVGQDSVWVLGDAIDRHLWRIDPTSGRVVQVIELPFAPGGVAAGLGGVWVTAQLDDKVLRIDPETGRIAATIPVGRGPWGIAVGARGIWVANTVDGTVSRIDPATNRVVATIRVEGSPEQVAVGAGSIWVAGHVG